MLPGTLGGQFTDQQWRIDLAALCDRCGARFVVANVIGLDLDEGCLKFSDHPNTRFDALSIGVGSVPAASAEHEGVASMVPIKPMQTFLQRFKMRMDAVTQRRTGPVKVAIVGGGVASVEIACCLQQHYERSGHTSELVIRVFTGDDRIARGMKPRSIRKIERLFINRGIRVNHNSLVTKVGNDWIGIEDGTRHAADVVVWTTGAAAPPVLHQLNLRTDRRGFIATSDTLQSLSDPRVFAVGDAGTVMEAPSPKAGVYAVRQGPVLSHNVRAFMAGGPMKKFSPQSNFLKLLNTGDGRALLEYGAFTIHARWCWHLKTGIDKRFIRQYQTNDPAT